MIGPFRFWVQSVLPTVYDDSLSYYELLNKVVEYLNKVIDETNKMGGTVNQLVNFVNHYFDSTDFANLVNEKLDEMAADGTLDAALLGSKMFVPDKSEKATCVDSIMKCALSYIYAMDDTDCVTERAVEPVAPARMKPEYKSDGKNWQSLVEKDTIYYQDAEFPWVEGELPVVYINCTGFVSLCTMGRTYSDSIYYKVFNDSSMSNSAKMNNCCEAGTWTEKPYTFDFLRRFHTWESFQVLRNSGCCPIKVYDTNENGMDLSLMPQMETGDILYHARSGNNYTNGLHHCLIYVKSVEDIEKYNNVFGCKFKPMSFSNFPGYDDNEYGYVIHCTWGAESDIGTTSANGRNVIRIESLKHYLKTAGDNYEWSKLYFCKPYANALNSSKAQRMFTFSTVANGEIRFGYPNSNNIPISNKFNPNDNKWTFGNVEVSNDAAVKGGLSVDNNVSADSLSIDNDATVGGDIDVSGDVSADSVHSAGAIEGNNLAIDNYAAIGGDMEVSGKASFNQAGIAGVGVLSADNFNANTADAGFYFWTSTVYPSMSNLPPSANNVAGFLLNIKQSATRFFQLCCYNNDGLYYRICLGGNYFGWFKLTDNQQ